MNNKINSALNKAFCEQYKRELGVDLKYSKDTIVYNKKRVVLTVKLKEHLREQLYDHLKDLHLKKEVVFN